MLRDHQTSVIARHTGLQPATVKVLRIGPSPAIEWDLSPVTPNPILLSSIRLRVLEGITASPGLDFPSVGIGWSSLTGQSNNCEYATPPIAISSKLEYAEVITNGDTLMRYIEPPGGSDKLVLRIGEFIDDDEIDEAQVAAGSIVVEVSYHLVDEWGDLPDAA